MYNAAIDRQRPSQTTIDAYKRALGDARQTVKLYKANLHNASDEERLEMALRLSGALCVANTLQHCSRFAGGEPDALRSAVSDVFGTGAIGEDYVDVILNILSARQLN